MIGLNSLADEHSALRANFIKTLTGLTGLTG